MILLKELQKRGSTLNACARIIGRAFSIKSATLYRLNRPGFLEKIGRLFSFKSASFYRMNRPPLVAPMPLAPFRPIFS